MQIAMAQINSRLGDFVGNCNKIIEFAKRAKKANVDLVVYPELALFGYWPADLLERKSIVEAQLKELKRIEKRVPEGIALLFGLVTLSEKKKVKNFYNSAAMVQKNKKTRFFHKELLPTYDVFDESRHFSQGKLIDNFFHFKGKKILVSICEDIWAWGDAWVGSSYPYNPFHQAKKEKPDLVINLSASPCSKNKISRRQSVVKKTAQYMKCPVIYVNLVGGQDELVFDGGSFVVDKKEVIQSQSRFFAEDLNIYNYPDNQGLLHETSLYTKTNLEYFRQALVVGIRDFVHKNQMSRVHLGLSGGIDSALVACLAAEALGPDKLTCIAMPTEFNAEESYELASQLAKNLGCKFLNSPIQEIYQVYLKNFESVFDHNEFNVTNENIQSRIRGNILMAYSNMTGSMLLATGNKSELATGYSTLYGDSCGGLAPIGDLLKTEVFALSRHYNLEKELIPKRIIDRPPSAELRPNQKDEDSLPPYEELDQAIERILVECKPARTKTEKWLVPVLYRNEFKRWQYPPILRMSQHAFGTGRRYPIANSARF